MFMSFPYGHWMKLPINTRHAIATQFGITKTKPTHVSNNEIVDDGYAYKDLDEKLKIQVLQQFLGSKETDYSVLWGWLVELMEGGTPKIPVPADSVVEVVEAPVIHPSSGAELSDKQYKKNIETKVKKVVKKNAKTKARKQK